ncbi:trigger factor [Desulfosalsimonas propionicica]|uniref:Trigger factor n=1 Tax=Desulfosalsimonas propionicica TaxID=332175 RepID=A0A7W0HLR8_9BACT|nr:trigger factor [Desulfosalsimonas propionicica]MBA2882291.1 trigger factor [Desulfosalsimonas propionicica]
MQVKVEDVSSVKKKIHVELPRQQVTNKLDEAYKQLKKTAKLKGYRPGKAPRSVLERHFKKDVHADVASSLVQESFPEAIKETDLTVLETSDVDAPDLDPESDYKYAATVELKPELPEVEYKGLNLKKTVYRVDESEIDSQIERLRQHLARYEPVEEKRPVVRDDYVVIDHQGFKDGQPADDAPLTTDDTIKLGASGFPEDFDKAIEGMQPGEEKEITVQFPEDYQKPELAGQEITYHVTLKELRQEILPPVDDELAKNFGEYETLADLRAEIRSHLEQGYQKRTDQELQEQMFNQLLTEEFEIPEVLVRSEMDEIIRDAEMKFSQNGLSMEQLGLTREHMEAQYRGVAEQQVRRHLLLNKIIEQENLEVTDDQLEPEYEKIAESTGQPADMIKSYYKQHPERLDGFKHALLEKQVIDLIINHANIEEVEAEAETADESK